MQYIYTFVILNAVQWVVLTQTQTQSHTKPLIISTNNSVTNVLTDTTRSPRLEPIVRFVSTAATPRTVFLTSSSVTTTTESHTSCRTDNDCPIHSHCSSRLTCVCDHLYSGLPPNCKPLSGCDSNPCLNNGLCHPWPSSNTNDSSSASYSCECEQGFHGINCQLFDNNCKHNNDCQNGGQCLDGVCSCINGILTNSNH
ncbi:unnamed protein product [Oppiella nova]|uniref:EGF-like domain-containing protein n=1 Tax=Oppiella nova TaxID=334625 RepID=A0A7R9MSZ3_9ACAR|nr:unnamed protein product [Oppiella nova]CAG2182386.1 unnamed protein product [Oppiella nova]